MKLNESIFNKQIELVQTCMRSYLPISLLVLFKPLFEMPELSLGYAMRQF